jgi:hypothetical protein
MDEPLRKGNMMARSIFFKCHGKKMEIIPIAGGIEKDSLVGDAVIFTPGRSQIEISKPVLSAENVSVDEPITCTVTVNGKNIAHIYSEVLLQAGDTLIGPVCRDFIHSPADHEVKGILHPHWMVENTLEFKLTPRLCLLYCGVGFTLACMQPEQYSKVDDQQIWSVEGVYQRGGGEPFRAKLEFNNEGTLVQKSGFYPASAEGLVSPFELFIEDGDTFEPYITMISESGEEQLATINPVMLGGGNLLHFKHANVPAGTFHVGVYVEDFDGQAFRNSTVIIVK